MTVPATPPAAPETPPVTPETPPVTPETPPVTPGTPPAAPEEPVKPVASTALGGEEPSENREAGAPENYEDFTLPEGYTVPDETMTSFKEYVKGANLSQEQAQKALDLGVQVRNDTLKQVNDTYTKMREDWVKELKEDPVLGGQNYPDTINRANTVLKKYADPQTIQWIVQSGAGDHPGLARMLVKIQKDLGEEAPTPPTGAGESGVKSDGQIFYGEQ